jgi:glycine dehydrogenase subunit 1
MRYIPNTEEQKEEMLKEIGVSSIEGLLKDIPFSVRVKGNLNLPEALSEEELKEEFYKISKKNLDFFEYKPLIGAGAYRHMIPEAIKAIISREEFYTSYTPYQPEISQGNLQSMFEYQTHISRLTGMDVVVPSIYDGASATAEAVLMSMRITHKNKVIVSSLLHPHYRETIETYVEPHNTEILEIPYTDGLLNIKKLESLIDDTTACVVIQSPNFLGGIEDVKEIGKIAHSKGILVVQTIVESMSLGLLKSPGEMDVDIVAGEAQPFGMDLNFGGPFNGYLASKMKFIRQIPGRIAGETTDKNGRRGFVMTFRAREQDIRREKATSNICSNHALNIVAGNAYLTLMGKKGFRKVSELNAKAAHYLYNKLVESGKFESPAYPFFNEFMLYTNDMGKIEKKLIDNKFIPPLRLSRFYPELEGYMLFSVTEVFTKDDLDFVINLLSR